MSGTVEAQQEGIPGGQGTLLLDRYRLVSPLGSGTFGTVWRAKDLKNPWREVAVKLLRAEVPSEVQSHRFRDEAHALELLSTHANIVTLFERGELNGRAFLVMEHIDGPSLQEWLGRRSAGAVPSIEEALRIGREVGSALAAAHALSVPGPIVHRDVKPANVMLKPSPLRDGTFTAQLMDFGIARLNGGGLTQEGQLLGTPAYMAPEQARCDEAAIGPWTDVFALGVLLVELLSLRPTAPDGTPLRELAVHAPGRLAALLRELRPGQPVQLAPILQKALHADVKQRYSNAGELVQALLAIPVQRNERRIWPGAVRLWTLLSVLLSTLVSLSVLIPMLRRCQPDPLPTIKPAHNEERAAPRDALSGMILLPGGAFRMGSNRIDAEAGYRFCTEQVATDCKLDSFLHEMPEREVALSPFYLDRTEVTMSLLAAWINQEKNLTVSKSLLKGQKIDRWVRQREVLLLDLYPTPDRSSGLLYDGKTFSAPPGRENKPATQMTWDAATRYCAAHGKRLPTEAEWEFAARRSPSFLYPWGNVPPHCADVVFRGSLHQTCSRDSGPRDVGMSPQDRSPDGVLDLGGSVSEWVQDAFYENYQPCLTSVCQDPVAQPRREEPAAERVVRGGNWAWSAATLRGLARSRWHGNEPAQTVGFRCARSVAR